MSHKMLRPFIVKVSVLAYFPLDNITYINYHLSSIESGIFNYYKR